MGKKRDIYDYLTDKKIKAWEQASNCNCNILDCGSNHKRCALCGNTVIFGAYEEMQPSSRYNWNIDHIIPKSKFNNLIGNRNKKFTGLNDINNLQITHVYCNNFKGEKYNSDYKNGYGQVKNSNFS